MTIIALIDPNACTAHGDCAEVAPDIFRVQDDLAVVIGEGPDELMASAAEACPTTAIRLVERETRRQLYP